MRKMTAFDIAYADALHVLMAQTPTANARTKKKVRAAHGLLFQFSPGMMPFLTLRDIKPLWACAEAVWFLAGGETTFYMEKFGFNVWKKFADDQGFVNSATGYRWRRAFGVDQVRELMHKLTKDPTSRQGVLSSWDPKEDNLNPGKNVPCVDMWHFHILEKQLHMSVLQRSGDMYFGVPHDVLGSHIVQQLLAAGLGVKPGAMSYLVSNAHLYEDQWAAAEEMMARAERMNRWGEGLAKMPESLGFDKNDFLNAMLGDYKLPIEMDRRIEKFYLPWPTIEGPKLVL